MASSSSHSGVGFDTFFKCFLHWRELKINLPQSCFPAHSVGLELGFFKLFLPHVAQAGSIPLDGLRLFQSCRGHPSDALPSPHVGHSSGMGTMAMARWYGTRDSLGRCWMAETAWSHRWLNLGCNSPKEVIPHLQRSFPTTPEPISFPSLQPTMKPQEYVLWPPPAPKCCRLTKVPVPGALRGREGSTPSHPASPQGILILGNCPGDSSISTGNWGE